MRISELLATRLALVPRGPYLLSPLDTVDWNLPHLIVISIRDLGGAFHVLSS
jgi:hypothetical protein